MIPMQSEKLDQLEQAVLDMQIKHGCVIKKNKDGGHAGFADLPQILEIISERGREFSLVIRQKSFRMDGENCVLTRLTHTKSGQWDAGISAVTVIDNPKNPNSEWAGSTTTHRRYDAMSIVGMFQADDPADHDNSKSEENDKGNSTFTDTKPLVKNDFISEKQQNKFRYEAKNNPAVAKQILSRYGSVDKIPWRDFQNVLTQLGAKTTTAPMKDKIEELFPGNYDSGEYEEVT